MNIVDVNSLDMAVYSAEGARVWGYKLLRFSYYVKKCS